MLAMRVILSSVMALAVANCGVFVPEKTFLAPDTFEGSSPITTEGDYENTIVEHIYCEVSVGLSAAYNQLTVQNRKTRRWERAEWLKNWGTSITLTITVEDQNGLTPGVTLTDPLQNAVRSFPAGGPVTIAQSASVGFGATASANATRTETIQYTYKNSDLVRDSKNPEYETFKLEHRPCEGWQRGVMIQSDLKIWQFIYDKTVIALTGNASGSDPSLPIYNTFTEDITFASTFGGNVTPTWKFARISANTSGTLFSAARTSTNEVTITIGPLQCETSSAPTSDVTKTVKIISQSDKETVTEETTQTNATASRSACKPTQPVQLQEAAQNQHNARVLAGAIAAATGN
jgi:hypothetical protein